MDSKENFNFKMSKYSKAQLLQLAQGVFKGSPALHVVYANSAGTFNNEQDFAAKTAAQQEGYMKITRAMAEGKSDPKDEAAEKEAAEKAKAAAAEKAKAAAAAKKEAAEKAKAEAAATKAAAKKAKE